VFPPGEKLTPGKVQKGQTTYTAIWPLYYIKDPTYTPFLKSLGFPFYLSNGTTHWKLSTH